MNRRHRPSTAWTILVLGAAALALGACGRKGTLDLPPQSSAGPNAAAVPADTEAEMANKPSVFNPTYGSEAPPAASKGRKRPFILDPLLDSH